MTRLTKQDLATAQRLLNADARETGETAHVFAEHKVSLDMDPETARTALLALGAIAESKWWNRPISDRDITAADRKMAHGVQADLREMFQAVAKLKEGGALEEPPKIGPLTLELVSSVGKADARTREIHKQASLEVFRLFQSTVRDKELHTGIQDQLRKRYFVPNSKLAKEERPLEITLRSKHERKEVAIRLLLAERNLPQNLRTMLVERLGECGSSASLPALEALAGSSDPAAAAARASMAAIQKASKMTIVFASMEVRPYCGTGGLGNVMNELPTALAKLGHRVIVLAPKHHVIDKTLKDAKKEGRIPQETGLSGSVSLPNGQNNTFTLAKDASDGVEYYFVNNEHFFSGAHRTSIYGGSDNAQRFDFFGKAIPEAIKQILGKDQPPDIIQLNDAHTAAASLYIARDSDFEKTRTVQAMHNLGSAYQGAFDAKTEIDKLGFKDVYFEGGPAQLKGRINFARLGLLADGAITVSHEYMKETLGKLGEGLQLALGSLYARSRLWGNLNGIDTDVWNPVTDQTIACNYSISDMRNKELCKRALQRDFGLPGNPNAPMMGVLARVTYQKGYEDIVQNIVHAISVNKDVQFAIIGDAAPNDEAGQKMFAQLQDLARRFPRNVGMPKGFEANKDMEHALYAGSDFFLMPSLFEPCGLPQMYSLRYLTIPIVRAVGGLEESIIDYNPRTGFGTGFKFEDDSDKGAENRTAFRGALDRALAWYGRPAKERRTLLENASKADFSWEKTSGREQLAFFREIMAMPKRNVKAEIEALRRGAAPITA